MLYYELSSLQVVGDGDVVGVRYRGTLDDGTVFDENPGQVHTEIVSSRQDFNAPYTFKSGFKCVQ